MRLNEISDNEGARRNRRRVGRGAGSGTGKTSGKGHKGQKSRAGASINGFEGGQMPIYRRLPKRGFKNPFRKEYAVLNVGNVEKAVKSGKLKAGAEVDETMLRELGLVGKKKLGVRLLAQGEISTKITLKVTGASKAAIAAVEGAGGTVELTGKSKKQ
ncbi:MAG: 50S ribosomal protein L15 [Rhodospirillaceae bacterium]|nr:50S ribosomal protein L15 [Rhodospirillaceae bacterium]|tara:strand:- start:1495 stop:1968 length:474 start_codon:yes stop_codon:yes gene_type:complete